METGVFAVPRGPLLPSREKVSLRLAQRRMRGNLDARCFPLTRRLATMLRIAPRRHPLPQGEREGA